MDNPETRQNWAQDIERGKIKQKHTATHKTLND